MKGGREEDYCAGLLGAESPVPAAVRAAAEVKYTPVLSRLSSALLETQIALCKPERILEIGTATGYSGIKMLMSAGSGARLYTVDSDEAAVSKAKQNFSAAGLLDRVTFFIGDANRIVPALSGEYEFIFLDGPKSRYIDFLPFLAKLLPAGGVLFCDNVLFKGETPGEDEPRRKSRTLVKNLRGFLAELSADKRFKTVVLPIGDGVSVSVRCGD